MMTIQPAFERSMLCPQALYAARILNRCIHLQSIPNDTRIAEQAGSICLTIRGNFVDIKGIIGGTKIAGFFQDRDPGKPGLVDLQNEAFKEQMVILEGKTILRIVINTIMSIFRMRIAIVTIRGHVDIFPSSSEQCDAGILAVVPFTMCNDKHNTQIGVVLSARLWLDKVPEIEAIIPFRQ